MLKILQSLAVIFFFSVIASAEKHPTGFLKRAITLDNTTYKYQVFVPSNWDSQRKWPVILFLHGAGERGTDGRAETKVGIGHAIREHAQDFPFIVVMPQCPKNQVWTDAKMQELALAALDREVRELSGDPERIYLTGISMGGYGTWELAANYPRRFAAYVPVCGGIHGPKEFPEMTVTLARNRSNDPYAETANRVGKVPVWIFHGDSDDTVPVEESRNMNAALHSVGGDVRYTEYPATGHFLEKAYSEPGLWKWLLQQHLPKQ